MVILIRCCAKVCCWPNALPVKLKTLASSESNGGEKCVCRRKKNAKFSPFFLCHSQYFFCRSFTLAVLGLLGFLGALTAWQPWQPVCSLLIQDNKCLSLGFRQLFTLSWRLRRGPGTLSDVLLFSRTFQFVPVTRPCSPFSLSTLGFVQVPAAFCIISALGFKVSAVALALICHLEVIFIYSRAKSSGNFMMTFRFQGFSQAFAI